MQESSLVCPIPAVSGCRDPQDGCRVDPGEWNPHLRFWLLGHVYIERFPGAEQCRHSESSHACLHGEAASRAIYTSESGQQRVRWQFRLWYVPEQHIHRLCSSSSF